MASCTLFSDLDALRDGRGTTDSDAGGADVVPAPVDGAGADGPGADVTCGAGCVASCRDRKERDPDSQSGVFVVAPVGVDPFEVWCDMTSDGGGWTVLSINGDLTSNACVHRLRSDAPACGKRPDLSTDWQLAGNLQQRITFREVLLLAYSPPDTVIAGSKLTLDSPRAIGDGILSGMPSGTATTPLDCQQPCAPLPSRSAIGITLSGYTAWGVPTATCGASVGGDCAIGLNVVTTGAGHDFAGWDDDNAGCGCSNRFLPADAGAHRGYLAVR